MMLKSLVVSPWYEAEGLALDLSASSIDDVWDSLASQVAYGDRGGEGTTVEKRFETDARLRALRDELARIEARGRKECQMARKNALFVRVKELKRQVVEIEEGARDGGN